MLGSILKSTKVDTDGNELAMAILYELLSQHEIPVVTLDALEDDENIFSLNLAKSRLLQEKKR